MIVLLVYLYIAGVLGDKDYDKYSLSGVCPMLSVQQNIDFEKVSGLWYHLGSYASDGEDIYDCATFDIQHDSEGYTLKETYVEDDDGNRTQVSYSVRLQTVLQPQVNAQYLTNITLEEHLVERPLAILSTDYNNYAVAYICRWLKEEKQHYIFVWVLTRSKEKLSGETLKKIEDVISKYKPLSDNREDFVFKEINESTCAFNQTSEVDFFSSKMF